MYHLEWQDMFPYLSYFFLSQILKSNIVNHLLLNLNKLCRRCIVSIILVLFRLDTMLSFFVNKMMKLVPAPEIKKKKKKKKEQSFKD